MPYLIVSHRVGEPGTTFEPSPDDNIDALLAGGFIQEVNTHPTKSARKDSSVDAEQNTKE